MWTSMLYTSILAILMADMRTGALQNKEVKPQRCYYCPNANSTCYQQKVSHLCPSEKPYCGTMVVGPYYESALKCLSSSKKAPCLIEYHSVLEISCVCSLDLCNAPFNKDFQRKLLEFENTTLIRNSSNIAGELLQFLNLENATDVYKILTSDANGVEFTPTISFPTLSTVIKVTEIPLTSNNSNKIDTPHAEPLKHETTVPPDDDEDESEGSGSYDDSKSLKSPASAPAASSAYVPAEENNASTESKSTLPVLFYFINVILVISSLVEPFSRE